ncbi:MAG: HAMP domain-containing protein, partial [Myxococcales bacterium]|nr:HAMP domain-containing protein [Myxococcales bacterium]
MLSRRERARAAHCRHPERRRARRRMFWRVYLHGIVLLVAVIFGAVIADRVVGGEPPFSDKARLAAYVSAELTPLLDRPQALQGELERFQRAFDVEVAVYRQDPARSTPERLASAGAEVPPPFDPPPAEPTVEHGREGPRFAVPLAAAGTYLVGHPTWKHQRYRWLLIPVALLTIMALVSFPMARAVTRPVERITRAARSLGEGDLSARTGIHRRDELGELARTFDEMASRLERMVGTERELLANVSHELRTPLARIRVALEIAEESDDIEGIKSHLQGIGDDLLELEQLIDQVMMTASLDMTEARSGGLRLRRAPVDLVGVAERSEQRFEGLHPDHRLRVETAMAAAVVDADEKLLHRVVDNLLDNAAKYSAPGAGAVELSIAEEPGYVVVEVRDRGIGVAEEDLPMLFEPFFRTDRSRERGTGGVGLGLALCRRIIEAHGGRIEAERR